MTYRGNRGPGKMTHIHLAKVDSALMAAIKSIASDMKRCPSNRVLGDMAELSEWQVKDSLKRLSASGEICREGGPGGTRRLVITSTGDATGWTDRNHYTVHKKRANMETATGHKGTMRQCLSHCGAMFLSSWEGNRICPRCREYNRRTENCLDDDYRVAL